MGGGNNKKRKKGHLTYVNFSFIISPFPLFSWDWNDIQIAFLLEELKKIESYGWFCFDFFLGQLCKAAHQLRDIE